MADIWLPGYRRVDLGLAGENYRSTANPKLVWHTTEGHSVANARDAFRRFPPHLCIDPRTGEAEQYVPLNRAAYACKANDQEYLIQVEVVGFANRSHTWDDAILERLHRWVVVPVVAATGVRPAVCSHGFHGEGEGMVLAHVNSPIRLTLAQLRAFSGHLGHQHMPPPDKHWDPGRLDIQRILSFQEDDVSWNDSIAVPDGPNKGKIFSAATMHAWTNFYAGETFVRVAAIQAQLAAIAADPDITADSLKAAVDQAVATHTPSAEQIAAAVDVAQRPHIEAAVRSVLGEDNAEQANAIVDQLVARLANPGAGDEKQ